MEALMNLIKNCKIPLTSSVILISFLLLSVGCSEKEYHVLIQTEFGDMKVQLYNSTPKHRDNFIKLVEEGYYNGLLFHRVIQGFMVQGGDPDSRSAGMDQMLGRGGPGYQVDAEIGAYHCKGALAAARMGDNVNPEKKSSGSQFYIVQGTEINEQDLLRVEQQKGFQYTDDVRARYLTQGGFPQLDGDYTVFGEVVEGFEVIDRISAVPTNQYDRPLQDVHMEIVVVN
jgi:cyclophilin family peptidyl-prolyl cis-trans isomerase